MACSSAVERLTVNQVVAGSIPAGPVSIAQGQMQPLVERLSYNLEETLDAFTGQQYYWGRVAAAYKSWLFRMFTLTESDLEGRVPKNSLRIHSIYCDKSQWGRGDGIQNFWIILNEGHRDMTCEFFGW